MGANSLLLGTSGQQGRAEAAVTQTERQRMSRGSSSNSYSRHYLANEIARFHGNKGWKCEVHRGYLLVGLCYSTRSKGIAVAESSNTNSASSLWVVPLSGSPIRRAGVLQ